MTTFPDLEPIDIRAIEQHDRTIASWVDSENHSLPPSIAFSISRWISGSS
jgi:hypothetical protein